MSMVRMANQRGFTLIEILITFAIFAITASLVGVTLIHPQTSASLNATVDALLVDIKNQQTKAMSGDSEGTAAAAAYGIYFQTNNYTLFRGDTYPPGDPDNFLVETDPVTISTTLPSSQLDFQKLSGEPVGYVAGSNTITVSNAGESKTITINRLGALTVN